MSEKRRARFGQRSCPRLARSVGSSANHAKQIGRTRIGNPLARIPSDGLRDAPRASTDGLARFLSDKLRSRSRTSIGRTHIRNPLARFPTDGLARIRKTDADSTISQPRYGRNQPPRNHEPTILRVEYKNDTISTKPSYFSDSTTPTNTQKQFNLNQKTGARSSVQSPLQAK